MPPIEQLPLSPAEAKMAEEIAEREGITREEAVNRVISAAFKRRTRKNTGKAPAKIYGLPRRRQ